MSPALNEDDGLSARSHLQKRCGTCKAALSPFEVPVCIVEANKGILPPLYLQENISQTGGDNKGG